MHFMIIQYNYGRGRLELGLGGEKWLQNASVPIGEIVAISVDGHHVFVTHILKLVK